MTKYDRTAFILAFIKANQPHFIHEDVKAFYTNRLIALQHAFHISLSFDGVRNSEVRTLWRLFHATVQSYWSIRSPRSDFLDDSLINRRLEQLGERGERITDTEAAILQANAISEHAHLQLLDELFCLLWEPLDRIVTSQDLLLLGFDDT